MPKPCANWSTDSAADGMTSSRVLSQRVLVAAGAASTGYLVTVLLPSLMAARPAEGSYLLAFGSLALSGIALYWVARLWPQHWLVAGLAFVIPAVGAETAKLVREPGTLWPIGAIGVLLLLVIGPLLTYVWAKDRRRPSVGGH